jgi:hypothetical protein
VGFKSLSISTKMQTYDYNKLFRSICVMIVNGERVYYSDPTIEYDNRLDGDACVVFKIRTVIPIDFVVELVHAQKTIIKKDNPHSHYHGLAMTEICNHVKKQTWDTRNTAFSKRITHMWGASTFEEWLDDHDTHWMEPEWFKDEDNEFSHYAVITMVKIPVKSSRKEFEDDYGSSFVMTKLMNDV